MGLGRNGAETHGAGCKASDDVLRRLDLVERHGRAALGPEPQQAAQRHLTAALVVDDVRIFPVRIPVLLAGGLLELDDRLGRPHVLLSVRAPGVFATRGQVAAGGGADAVGGLVEVDRLLHHLEEADAVDLRGRAREVALDEGRLQADRLEDPRAAVAHQGRDAHLGHHLGEALAHGLDVVGDGLVGREPGLGREILERHEGHVGMHRLGAVAHEEREVVRFSRGARAHHEARRRAQALGDQVLMKGRGRQERGNRHAVLRDRLVGEDEDRVTEFDRVDGLSAQAREAGLDARAAPGGGIGDVDHLAPHLARGVVGNREELAHLRVRKDGLRDLDAPRLLHVVDVEHVGLRTDVADEARDELLADRIDRRVRHLSKELLEVLGERLGLLREDRERDVVAHAAHGLHSLSGHRHENEVDVLLGEAEDALQLPDALGADGFVGLGLGGAREVGEPQVEAVDPLAIGLGEGELVLDLVVLDDAPAARVDEEHLARLDAPLAADAAFGNGQDAHFAREHDRVVIGEHVTRGPEAVAVKRRADLHAVREDDGGRTVPGLHHRGMICVEGAPVGIHRRRLLPGFGHEHEHRLRERIARHHHQLDGVVKARRVGLAVVDDRGELADVAAEHGRLPDLLAGAQPEVVAADRVDFAVVRDVAVRVRKSPAREGVGRESLVHDGDGALDLFVLQVEVVLSDLVGKQQALVDDGARAHRRHEVLGAVRELQGLNAVGGRLADDVELALERGLDHHVGPAADEDLADDGRARLHGRTHRHPFADGNVAPAEHDLAFAPDRALELLFAGGAGGGLLRQEDHADAVVADCGKLNALRTHLLAVEGVRNLNENARAVAAERIGAHGASMVEVVQNQQRVLNDLVRRPALDVDDGTHAARVVLEFRTI